MSKVDGEPNIYMMNKDGSSKKKIIEHGTHAAWLKWLTKQALRVDKS